MFTTGFSRVVLFVSAVILALVGGLTLRAQVQPSGSAAFEVISIKASPSQPVGGRGKFACGGAQVEPRRFAASKSTVYFLIALAYAQNCSIAEAHDLISGGPGWVKSDQFEVQAVIPAGTPTPSQQYTNIAGPEVQSMIRDLLSERFRLRIHRENKEMSVYALTVSKNGSKLELFDENSCVPPPPPMPPQGEKRPFCRGDVGIVPDTDRGGWRLQVMANGKTLEKFSEMLSLALDRPVIDRTGISGIFDLRLESALEGTRMMQFVTPDGNQPRTVSDPAPSIFTAIQDQLGLRLEATKGTVPTLVIDSIQRPTEN